MLTETFHIFEHLQDIIKKKKSYQI